MQGPFQGTNPSPSVNVSCKIITKIIANRIQFLLPKIISSSQGGFVPKRKIWDNIILVQEAIHSSKLRGERGMVIKLDMENTFDRVNHNFLLQVLRKYGFHPSFINWL
jgi:hypothetical protein